MPSAVYPSSRYQSERAIAAARVALAIASVFAVWMDPAEPARFAALTYSLHLIYVSYALLVAAFVWLGWRGGNSLPLATHVFDIAAFSVIQYLTLGPSSPFFVYFIFSLFCGAMRWGWRGTLATGIVVVLVYLLIGAAIPPAIGAAPSELNRFIIRVMYLIVAASLLVYLGRYEARMRDEMERLARWPKLAGLDVERSTRGLVEHAGRLLRASRLAVVWEGPDEPWSNVAAWPVGSGAAVTRLPPGEPIAPLSDVPAERIHTVPFETERVTGRVLFVADGTPAEEMAPLAQVVAREIGGSLDQLSITERLREIAAREERIRVARDLHDGVLQSLTGIRLELRAVAGSLNNGGEDARGRLFALERALAIEQRELRLFIGDLKPQSGGGADQSLAGRLDALRERIALEWQTPVTISIAAEASQVPPAVAQAVPLMVHEAVVNALKHGQPSRVGVVLAVSDGKLHIVVSDDGHGFAFKGRLEDAALRQSATAPRSLMDRVSAFGGRMAINSSDTGSRIEMVLSL